MEYFGKTRFKEDIREVLQESQPRNNVPFSRDELRKEIRAILMEEMNNQKKRQENLKKEEEILKSTEHNFFSSGFSTTVKADQSIERPKTLLKANGINCFSKENSKVEQKKNILKIDSAYSQSQISLKKKEQLKSPIKKIFGFNTALATASTVENEMYMAYPTTNNLVEVKNIREDKSVGSFESSEQVDLISMKIVKHRGVNCFMVVVASNKRNFVSCNTLYGSDRYVLRTHSFSTPDLVSAVETVLVGEEDFFYCIGMPNNKQVAVFNRYHQKVGCYGFNHDFAYNQIPSWVIDNKAYILAGIASDSTIGRIINISDGEDLGEETQIVVHFPVQDSVIEIELDKVYWYTIQRSDHIVKYDLTKPEQVKQKEFKLNSKLNLVTEVEKYLIIAEKAGNIYLVDKESLSIQYCYDKVANSQLKALKGGKDRFNGDFVLFSEGKSDKLMILWNLA